ncbi:hypothetical protein [Brevibacillus sp. Leaf182]|uniref:hypothetical protein n=1 Tax=Brevibacillus sp. Leaf182 TaxID=1736290 RepID=UPI0006F61245|nr:hypothetical protein [Brevibacillus sp. Leaf182]
MNLLKAGMTAVVIASGYSPFITLTGSYVQQRRSDSYQDILTGCLPKQLNKLLHTIHHNQIRL